VGPSVERTDSETRAGAAQGGRGRAGGVLRRSRQCLHRSARPEAMWGRAAAVDVRTSAPSVERRDGETRAGAMQGGRGRAR
jgi:hypothetical protein